MEKSSGINYQLVAITLGLILFSGSISGSASVAFADNDDKKEKFKKLLELLKKFREKYKDKHDDRKKMLVCHIPNGDINKAHTISVSKRAVQSHLDHGDFLGKCGKYEDKRDKKDPEIKIISPKKNKKVEGPTITIIGTAKDKGTGVESVMVRLDYGSYQTVVPESDGTWTIEFTDVDEGKHKVTAKAVDFAGNDKRKSIKIKVI